MKSPLFSIIVPIYNSEKFLARCLDSIITQSESDFELILIDNNSTDDSKNIIHSYVKNNPNKIFTKTCGKPGAGAARNLGVLFAHGKYLIFVDSDDYLLKNALKNIKSAIKSNADPDFMMLTAKTEGSLKDSRVTTLPAVEPQKGWQSRYIIYGSGAWQNVYLRDFWNKNLTWPEGIIHEDMALTASAVLYSDRFASLNSPVYFHTKNPESVEQKSAFSPKIFDIFEALDLLFARFKKLKKFEQYHDELEYLCIWNLLRASAGYFRKDRKSRRGFKLARGYLNSHFPNWRQNPYLKQKSFSIRLKCYLAYFGI